MVAPGWNAAFALVAFTGGETVAPETGEGLAAMAGFEAEAGIELSLFAAEPQVANPVCLYVGEGGEVYVAETFRHYAGVTDLRDHMDWLEEDLANRTVADRVAMFQRHAADFEREYESEREQIRLLRDTDGDGLADQATVFSDRFTDAAAGIGAGLLTHGDQLYYTCIPDLWALRDTDGDDRADEERVLSTGYGVHVAMLGHDLHGLRIGPDMRLYFSCGDRGFSVRTEAGVVENLDSGAVLRCELDGSGLEVFATGLRNPQELVFDDLGNLFTGDNNGDGGDRARWVHVVEGGDSGWRYGYQWMEAPNLRGPWNDEKLWHPEHEGQAGHIVPPIANLGAGPSGLTYYPGTGLGDAYRGHFFLCDFRGEPSISGVHTFALEERGASYSLGEVRPFVWGTLVTDCDFGPDGSLYFSDWIAGWSKTGKGRIYRATGAGTGAAEVAEILGAGFEQRTPEELGQLLGHADRRVRQGAQFELVGRGEAGAQVFQGALDSSVTMARIHAVWGLGILARRGADVLGGVRGLLADEDPELRVQAARVLGDVRDTDGSTASGLAKLLFDDSARVQFHAAEAVGKLRVDAGYNLLFRLFRKGAESDPTLRHAVVRALAAYGYNDRLSRTTEDDSAFVRRGAVLTLRRLGHPDVGLFLQDPDLAVRLDAARAAHDLGIPRGLDQLAPLLAGLASAPETPAAFVRRALNANYRLGTEECARRVADFALADTQPAWRAEALDMLLEWGAPSGIDKVTGAWRPLEARATEYLPSLVAHLAERGLTGAEAGLVDGWIELVGAYDVRSYDSLLLEWTLDEGRADSTRLAALDVLEQFEDPALPGTLRGLLSDPSGAVRAASLEGLARLAPELLPEVLGRVLRGGTVGELRSAYTILGRLGTPEADSLLAEELDRLQADLVPDEVALELVRAAELRDTEILRLKLERHAQTRMRDLALGPYLDSIWGGDAEAGKRVYQSAAVSCIRCHRVENQTGTEVGPDLVGVSQRLTRLQMLETIVDPNRRTTAGYENWIFRLQDGRTVAGRIVAEGEGLVRVQTADSQLLEFDPSEVELKRRDLSAMPGNLAQSIDRFQMRDLMAYLATL